MDTGSRTTGEAERAAREQLARDVEAVTGAPHERRHDELMEWAEAGLGLDRGYAEQIYALAEEEDLEPIYALHVVSSGVGVRELEKPEQDTDPGAAAQQAPPKWVDEDAVEFDDVALERRLRATFRRLRSHLDAAASPGEAVRAFLQEPDVGLVRLR